MGKDLIPIMAITAMMSTGQILFKLASRTIPEQIEIGWPLLFSLAKNFYLIAGVLIYGTTTLLWVYVLKDSDLSRSYLMVSLSFVLVPTAGFVLFGEQLSIRFLLGATIMLAGAAVIALEK